MLQYASLKVQFTENRQFCGSRFHSCLCRYRTGKVIQLDIAILTFQFAHNYGALLQAYALKRFLQNEGHHVKIAPFFPDWAQKEYSISPFSKGITVRKRIRFTLQYPKRRLLAEKFHQFQREMLEIDDSFETQRELEEYLNAFEAVVFGSDQIWNDKITGDTDAYYGGNISSTRIAYAASLGTKRITAVQKKYIKELFPRFKAISVRESTSKKLLEEVVDIPVTAVADPVFLLSRKEWEEISVPVETAEKFMLLYFLRDDPSLLAGAKRIAEEHDLVIYEVHPTLARFHDGCTPLYHVGPREFVWLIQHAEYVCTNSFHATSFSVIFRKKLLHIPNEISPERTISLLSYIRIDMKENAGTPLYDLSKCDYSDIEELIGSSKEFLNQALR